MLIPLAIPPGLSRLGTDLQSAGRWRDGNLIRWREGVMQPVGGWVARATDPLEKPPRGAHVWRTNGGARYIGVGTYNSLTAIDAANVVTDITPAGLTAGLESAGFVTGYGIGLYGAGDYGVDPVDSGTFTEAGVWSIDNWGENLIACSTADGRIVEWALDVDAKAVAITNAPTSCLGVMVTEERFVFALGAGGDSRKIQWSDQENNTVWAPLATNQAGDILLQTPGQIMCGVRTRGQALILTDQDAHTATYTGPPFVYGFERVGTACGIISRMAAVSTDAGVFWIGRADFYRYAGGAVESVPCEVADFVFNDMNRGQMSKVWGASLAYLGEIWWFYPSRASLECDRYVAFNFSENHWSTGSLDRTAGIPRGVFQNPIWFDSNGQAYDQELGNNLHGSISFVRSGPVQLGNGDNVLSAVRLIPDEATQGESTMTFTTRLHPNDTARDFGPYTMANPTSVRFTGRQFEVQIDGAAMQNWRVGVPRVEVQQRGRR